MQLHVLVVEDNRVNIKVILRLLTSCGIQIEESSDVAMDGLQALDVLKRRRYDLVLRAETVITMCSPSPMNVGTPMPPRKFMNKYYIVCRSVNISIIFPGAHGFTHAGYVRSGGVLPFIFHMMKV